MRSQSSSEPPKVAALVGPGVRRVEREEGLREDHELPAVRRRGVHQLERLRERGPESEHHRRRPDTAITRTVGNSVTAARSYPAAVPFSIAQVTPWPWEQHHEVNRFVERLSDELCARGHRVVVVAPSDSRELVREGAPRSSGSSPIPTPCSPSPAARRCSRSASRCRSGAAARCRCRSTCRARSRTCSTSAELDFVHVHEPFAPSASSAALRHSRALNVGTFHSTTERFVSTQVARRVVELLFGRLDGRTASFAATRDLIERYFPGEYRVIRPGADLLHRPGSDGGPPEIVFSAEEERGALRALPARAAPLLHRARLARHDLAARPGLGAGGHPVAPAARARAAGRARRRLGGPAPGPGRRSPWRPRPAPRRRRSSCCARSPAARCRWSRACPSTRRRCARASSACCSSRATRSRSPPSSSG